MALSDWEILIGEGLLLTSDYAVSGSKSLTQEFDKGMVFMVHKDTYADAPLNIRIDTWMTRTVIDAVDVNFYVGAIARKLSDSLSFVYWLLHLKIDDTGYIVDANTYAGYYLNGAQHQEYGNCVQSIFSEYGCEYWNEGKWRWLRFEGYGMNEHFRGIVKITPNIDQPDPLNPPETQLITLDVIDFSIPVDLKTGGACGIIVGGLKGHDWTTCGEPIYDYTQIYY